MQLLYLVVIHPHSVKVTRDVSPPRLESWIRLAEPDQTSNLAVAARSPYQSRINASFLLSCRLFGDRFSSPGGNRKRRKRFYSFPAARLELWTRPWINGHALFPSLLGRKMRRLKGDWLVFPSCSFSNLISSFTDTHSLMIIICGLGHSHYKASISLNLIFISPRYCGLLMTVPNHIPMHPCSGCFELSENRPQKLAVP